MADAKVILITGTSTGFGRLAAIKLAELGHRVYASMRGVKGKNAEAAASLDQANERISVLDIDVTKSETIEAAVGQLLAKESRLDVLINNAGVMNTGLTETFSTEELHHQMDVNYFGVARMFKAVLPQMRQQGEGLIMTVTSIAGRIVIPTMTSYNSTKFATEALAEGYRYELSSLGIDSVIVQPGPFKTAIIGNRIKPSGFHVAEAYGPLSAMPEQVVNGFEAFMEDQKDGDCDPQIVVDDMIHLINTPFGERPLRTVSGIDYGVRGLNQAVASFQNQLLEGMEMSHLNPTSQAVGT